MPDVRLRLTRPARLVRVASLVPAWTTVFGDGQQVRATRLDGDGAASEGTAQGVIALDQDGVEYAVFTSPLGAGLWRLESTAAS